MISAIDRRIKIEAFAVKAHNGQFRKDGKPYWTHPLAVASKAVELAEIEQLPIGDDIIYCTAMLHDVLEDTKTTADEIEELLYEAEFDKSIRFAIQTALQLLTKRPDMTAYEIVDYTIQIKRNPLARIVKLADIDHNCSDLKEGNLKQKYFLQRHILCQ